MISFLHLMVYVAAAIGFLVLCMGVLYASYRLAFVIRIYQHAVPRPRKYYLRQCPACYAHDVSTDPFGAVCQNGHTAMMCSSVHLGEFVYDHHAAAEAQFIAKPVPKKAGAK